MWRLEFQARGAPHVHALIWLDRALPLAAVGNCIFATVPSPLMPVLRHHVLTHMTHTCNLARCKKGIAEAPCRYGFPKNPSDTVHYDDHGILCFPRSEGDSNIVEYNPFFLLHWDGHCHIHVLRSEEQPDVSETALSYILKYNFKPEPNLSVSIGTPDRLASHSTFHARVLSAEEAAARILGMTFCASDVDCRYCSFRPLASQIALFRDGVQVQMSVVEQYFHRPASLERMGILPFLSYYEIKASSTSNETRISFLIDNSVPYHPMLRARPPGSLSPDSNWELEHLPPVQHVDCEYLFPYEPLPKAKTLTCRLRCKPKIVITEKFTESTYSSEHFCFLILLLSGCWRSEEEMLAGCSTWREALDYHGVVADDSLEELQLRLLSYMLTSSRYSPNDIVRVSANFKFDVSSALLAMQSSLPETFHPFLTRVAGAVRDFQLQRQLLTADVPSVDDVDDSTINHFIHYTFTDEQIAASRSWLDANIPKLNRDQQTVYSYITSALYTGVAVQTNCFVMGQAGTGKSFLISSLTHYFTVHQIPHVLCASTGIAAMLIGGKTVHSTFCLSTDANEDRVFCNLHLNRPVGVAVSRVAVIVIDEVTMLSAKCLDALDKGLRRLMAEAGSKHHEKPFGGKSILLFGDLAQVPAVIKTRDDYLVHIGQFTGASNFDQFLTFRLAISMRADDRDVLFAQLLADVRDPFQGRLKPETIDILRASFHPDRPSWFADVCNFLQFDSHKSMVIAFRNARCHTFNSLMLNTLDHPVLCKARFYVSSSRSYVGRSDTTIDEENNRQRNSIAQRPAFHSEESYFRHAMSSGKCPCLTPADLRLAIGARVMLLKNISPDEGLVNGAMGVVRGFDEDENHDIISVSVSFFHLDACVSIARFICQSYRLQSGDKIHMYQFPLMLSWATTAHKSQGQTLDRIAINISDPAFAHGALYVALSRVRRLADIYLFGLPDWPPDGPSFHINTYIREEMVRMTEDLPF